MTLLPQPDGSPSAVVVQSKTGGATVLDRPYMVATVTDKQIGSEQTGEAMLNDLKDLPAPELTIIGHTDAVGTDAFNDELSRQRANSVVAMLKARGINTQRVSAVGRGSREPLVPARKGVPEARNRRVEIRLK